MTKKKSKYIELELEDGSKLYVKKAPISNEEKRISELERRVDFIYEQLEEILKKFD